MKVLSELDTFQHVLGDVLHYGHGFGQERGSRSGRAALPDAVREAAKRPTFDASADALVEIGIDALQRTFDETARRFDARGMKTHVVPLSAGLDSRATLSALASSEHVDREQILAVTFGTPGTWDFDIARNVASEVDVRHLALDLTSDEFEWSPQLLEEYAATQVAPNKFFEGFINATVPATLDDADSVFWSGVMGDAVAGKETQRTPAADWESACRRFAEFNRLTDERLRPPSYDPLTPLPTEPWLPSDKLDFRDQLTLGVERPCFLEPLVISPAVADRYVRVFLQPEWLSFMLRVPREYRVNRKLFKRIVRRAYPNSFALPTDDANGLPLGTPKIRQAFRGLTTKLKFRFADLTGTPVTNPWLNYVDFESELRNTGRLQDVVRGYVSDFAERQAVDWIDVSGLWDEHQRGRDNNLPLRLVASMELYLKTR